MAFLAGLFGTGAGAGAAGAGTAAASGAATAAQAAQAAGTATAGTAGAAGALGTAASTAAPMAAAAPAASGGFMGTVGSLFGGDGIMGLLGGAGGGAGGSGFAPGAPGQKRGTGSVGRILPIGDMVQGALQSAKNKSGVNPKANLAQLAQQNNMSGFLQMMGADQKGMLGMSPETTMTFANAFDTNQQQRRASTDNIMQMLSQQAQANSMPVFFI